MATRGRDEAENDLKDLLAAFGEAVDAGNRRFWDKHKDDAHCITSIARAGLIRCFIADELKQRLDGRPKINISDKDQTTLFSIDTKWVLKVHKMDEGNRSAVNSTQRSLDFNDNDLNTIDLFGIEPSATMLFLGYIENVADHLAPQMRLTCPDGDSPAWSIDLGTSLPPPTTEITPPEPNAPDEGTKVVVRRRKESKFTH